jgi:hypothetical protein
VTSPNLARLYNPATASKLGLVARSLRLNDFHGLIEFEGQHRLRRDFDGTALGQNLCQCAASGAGSSSDRCAFTATRNGADNRPDRSSATCIFRGSLVCAKPLLAALCQIAGAKTMSQFLGSAWPQEILAKTNPLAGLVSLARTVFDCLVFGFGSLRR